MCSNRKNGQRSPCFWRNRSMDFCSKGEIKAKSRFGFKERPPPTSLEWVWFPPRQKCQVHSLANSWVFFNIPCLHSILSFSNWYEGDSSYIIKLVGSSICHCHYLPVIPKMRRKGTFKKVREEHYSSRFIFWSIRRIINWWVFREKKTLWSSEVGKCFFS